MGQTLTHGIYLPDEGERNCYDGLAANWQLLDGAVGTVAEHTTALAGKAPLVHTHGKADITDFPAYGTTAGTICEGNDSRLSDARTPVAHTHGKADIKDLFNSANTWTDTNTYTVTGDVPIKITNGKDATNPSATEMKDIRFLDVNGKIIGGVRHSLESGGTSKMHLYSRSFSSAGSSNSNHGLLIVNNKQTGVHEVQSESNFIPNANNAYDLGSSSYQWKTLNGINPGALSLPNYSDTTYIDISGSIVPPSGETTINYSGGENQYTPPVDGWLSIRCDGATFLQIHRNAYNCPGTTASRQNAAGKLVVTLPVLKNTTYTIKINTSGSTNLFQLYPCLGNV